jgi:hypothetical protein
MWSRSWLRFAIARAASSGTSRATIFCCWTTARRKPSAISPPLVDASRSQGDVLEPERKASHVFLDQVLRPGQDKAFIAQFNTRAQLLEGFTSSRQELAAALDGLRSRHAGDTALPSHPSDIGIHDAPGTWPQGVHHFVGRRILPG